MAWHRIRIRAAREWLLAPARLRSRAQMRTDRTAEQIGEFFFRKSEERVGALLFEIGGEPSAEIGLDKIAAERPQMIARGLCADAAEEMPVFRQIERTVERENGLVGNA